MELLVIRNPDGDRTPGSLFIDGSDVVCWTLEDRAIDWKVEKKVPGKTAIPCGRYRVTIDMSTRWKKLMLHILDVPQFDGVRMHGGNTVFDTLGCILLGMVKTQEGIRDCKRAVDKVFAMVKAALDRGEEVWITVSEDRGAIAA